MSVAHQTAVVTVSAGRRPESNEALYFPSSPIASDCDHVTNAAKGVARVNREFLRLTSTLARNDPAALKHALKIEWSQDDINFIAALTTSQIEDVAPVVGLLYIVRPAAIRKQLAETFNPDDPHAQLDTPATNVVAANVATKYLSSLNREALHLLRELTRIDLPASRCATGINFDVADGSLYAGLSVSDIEAIAYSLVPAVVVRPRDLQTYFQDQDPISLVEAINVQARKSLR